MTARSIRSGVSFDCHAGFDVFGDVPACVAGTIGVVDGDRYVDLARLESVLLDEASVDSTASASLSRRPLVLRVFVPVTGFRTMSTMKLLVELSWLWDYDRRVPEFIESFLRVLSPEA